MTGCGGEVGITVQLNTHKCSYEGATLWRMTKGLGTLIALVGRPFNMYIAVCRPST
jgi:hypothetical protein